MKTMKELLALVENATRENPMDVTAVIDDVDTYTVSVHSDSARIGELVKTDNGEYEFRNPEPSFEKYEGMNFDSVEDAEEFFKEMTKNDDAMYENSIFVVNENNPSEACVVYDLPEGKKNDTVKYLNESVFGSGYSKLKAHSRLPKKCEKYPSTTWKEFKNRFSI